MVNKDYKNYNSIALAFMGDAVFEQFVRLRVLKAGEEVGNWTGRAGADRMHREAVRYVKAEAQAKAVKALAGSLSEDEEYVVKHARNHRISSKPKNADPLTYKWATAFEALLGYLYLSGRDDRLAEVMKQAAETIEAAR